MGNKKTIIIVVVVIAVAALGYWGYQRWQKQRLVNAYLKAIGVPAGSIGGGILNAVTGQGGQISAEIAKEIAKQEASDQTNEQKEAAKTPEQKFNDTQEMQTYDATGAAIVAEARSLLEPILGKTKLISYSSGFLGGAKDSGAISLKISRLTTGNDVGEINKALTAKGFTILGSGVEDNSATIMATKQDQTSTKQYIIGFTLGEQDITMTIANENSGQ